MAEQYKYNQQAADAAQTRGQQNYQFQKDVDEQFNVNAEERAVAAEEQAYQTKIKRLEGYFERLGFTPDEIKQAVAAANGIKLPDKKTGKADDNTLKNVQDLHNMLDKRIKNLTAQLKNEDGLSGTPDPTITLQLADAIRTQQQLENIYGGLLGINGVGENGVEPFSDNEELNTQSLATLWQISGGDMALYKENVDRWLTDSHVTPRFKEQYLKNLKSFGGGER